MSYILSQDIFYLVACEVSLPTLLRLFTCCKKLYTYHRHPALFRYLLTQRYHEDEGFLDDDLWARSDCLTLIQRMDDVVYTCIVRDDHTLSFRPPFLPGVYPFIPYRLPQVYADTDFRGILDIWGTLYVREKHDYIPFLRNIQQIKILHDQLLILDREGHLTFYTSREEPRDYHHVLGYFRYTDIEVGSYSGGAGIHNFYCALDRSGELWIWQYRDIVFPTRIPLLPHLQVRQVQVNFGVKFDDKNHERYIYLVDRKNEMYVLTLYPEKVLRHVPLSVRSMTLFDRDYLAVITTEGRLALIKNMRGYMAVRDQPFEDVRKVIRYRRNHLLMIDGNGRLFYYHNDVVQASWSELKGIRARDITAIGDQIQILGSV